MLQIEKTIMATGITMENTNADTNQVYRTSEPFSKESGLIDHFGPGDSGQSPGLRTGERTNPHRDSDTKIFSPSQVQTEGRETGCFPNLKHQYSPESAPSKKGVLH